ncbi:MAG TPA: hypothetical protein VLE89_06810 [Chlamydiales bacterium]|nr:hypothetical protein [Chlamydiales bacterium]
MSKVFLQPGSLWAFAPHPHLIPFFQRSLAIGRAKASSQAFFIDLFLLGRGLESAAASFACSARDLFLPGWGNVAEEELEDEEFFIATSISAMLFPDSPLLRLGGVAEEELLACKPLDRVIDDITCILIFNNYIKNFKIFINYYQLK